MKNGDAIKIMSRMKQSYIDTKTESMLKRESSINILKAYDEAIQALEQTICTDAISRVAAIDKLDEWDWQEFYLPIHFKELLDELPPVSVAEKVGHGIFVQYNFDPRI